MPSDTYFAVFLQSYTDFGLMYTCSDSFAFRQHVSLFCCVLIQISVLMYTRFAICLQTHVGCFLAVLHRFLSYVLMYTRSARSLLSDMLFAVLLVLT